MRSRRVESREIKDRCWVLRQALELLPTSVVNGTARTSRGPDNTLVLRGDRGQLYAQFHDHALAKFTMQAPGHLQAFMTYIEQLEENAYNDRERRREAEEQLAEVTSELLGAAGLGINTKDGQRRIQSAIAAVREGRHRRR